MASLCKFIPQISASETNWSAKIIVAGKQSPKTARNSISRYQNLTFMDLQGNKVTATMYDANITALQDEFKLRKTYIVSNATVKDIKTEFQSLPEEKIWTITGRTKVQETNEDHLEFLFSKYEITPFDDLEKHMDKNTSISVLGVAVDIRQKRFIQTKFGTQACLQDVVLIDKQFRTIILTLWDTFVEEQCITIVENLANKPVVWATDLKVSSFNGITLSTKVNSAFFIDVGLLAIAEYKNWVETNKQTLTELVENQPFVAITPPKFSPPNKKNFIPIADLLGVYLPNKFYWVTANWRINSTRQTFWYMSCSNCKKTSTADFEEIHKCRFCKYEHANAIPRMNAFLQLEDKSGSLDAAVIGDTAEALLETNANVIMNHSIETANAEINTIMKTESETEVFFYLKVTEKRHTPPEYRFEVIFVLDSIESLNDNNASTETTVASHNIQQTFAEIQEYSNEKDTSNKEKIYSRSNEVSKRSLFQPSTYSQQKKKPHVIDGSNKEKHE